MFGRETFLRYDPETGALVEERESVRAFFTSSAGSFEVERVGVLGVERVDEVRVALRVERARTAYVVVRDSRGGLGWRGFRVSIAGR